jgi:hypothetical protein
MQQLRTNATRQGRVPAAQKYLEELEKGTWDEVNYDASRESVLLHEQSASAELSFALLPPHSSAVPTGVRKMKDGRDANGIGKVVFPPGTKLAELPAPHNQIFIKTIPPTIGRHALEAVSVNASTRRRMAVLSRIYVFIPVPAVTTRV